MLKVKKLLNFLIAMSKRCSKCGEVKDLSAFNKYKSKNKNSIVKKVCRSLCIECGKLESSQYYAANKKRCNDTSMLGYIKNKERYKSIFNLFAQYNADNLTNYYIEHLLSNNKSLEHKDVRKYEMLIQAKREHIKLKRLIKQLSK